MKKTSKKTLAQFSLTVICSMLLAACGSSSSGSPTTASTSTTAAQQQAAAEAAAAQAAAEKAAAEKAAAEQAAAEAAAAEQAAAEKAAAEKAAAEQAAAEAAAAAAAAAAATENHVAATTTPVATGLADKGTKTVVKYKSDFTFVNQDTSDVASLTEKMGVQAPNRRLDNLVVAESTTKEGKAAVVYLEDLDLYASNAADGVTTLKGIHAGAKTNVAGSVNVRTDDRGVGTSTKTNYTGTDEGKVLTFQDGRLNYTQNYEGAIYEKIDGRNEYKQSDNSSKLDVAGGNNIQTSRFGFTSDFDDTVGEVYGHRTQVGDETTKANFNAASSQNVTDVSKNLPLVNSGAGGTLKHVQYGRVTSQMSGKSLDDFRKGVDLGSNIATFVGSYGNYGEKGTEDHYFYRGVDTISQTNLDSLKAAGGKLNYEGHAVTYGLDHNYNGFASTETAVNSAPTSVNAIEKTEVVHGLISGTHVQALVDLATNQVTGSAYNKWINGETKKAVDVNLVEFSGTMAANGNIAGTATNKTVAEDSALRSGVFSANLYGSKADEMGGSFHSNDKGEQAWGGVYGAQKVEAAATSGLTNSVNVHAKQ